MIIVRKAVISVSDKEGILEFAKGLTSLGIELLATEGTVNYLAQKGIKAETVSAYTGQKEILGGRVKTLHPKIFAPILATRQQETELKSLGLSPFDMVIVNLYPFEATIAKPGITFEEAMENIDIGGVSLIRAAAKNADRVAIITGKHQYQTILDELKKNEGKIGDETLHRLAVAAFEYTSAYDTAIYNYLWRKSGQSIPPALRIAYSMGNPLRYGENPYQKAAFFLDTKASNLTVAGSELLHGKPLSYNNILDLDAALNAASEFEEPSAAVIKHTNPCGFALGESLAEAYIAAHEGDPVSAYGCVVGLNSTVDIDTAKAMKKHFIEAIIAPDYNQDTLELLKMKKNIRLMKTGTPFRKLEDLYMVKVSGGMLVQTKGFLKINPEEFKVVTKVEPTKEQLKDMIFGLRVSRYVKSNSIILVKDLKTVGIGAGQMSRVDACHIATYKAGERAKGSVLASDAFFPFRDGVDIAGKAGVAAIVQPGGSIRDNEAIQAADEYGISMVFCGFRTFRH